MYRFRTETVFLIMTLAAVPFAMHRLMRIPVHRMEYWGFDRGHVPAKNIEDKYLGEYGERFLKTDQIESSLWEQ